MHSIRSYKSAFLICGAVAFSGVIILAHNAIGPGEGGFGAAKAAPLLLVIFLPLFFCLIWFPANLVVFFWMRREQKTELIHPDFIVICSAVPFIVAFFSSVFYFGPRWYRGSVEQHYEALASRPGIDLRNAQVLIDSYCAESGRGTHPYPPSGIYEAIRILSQNRSAPPEVLNRLADALDDRSPVLLFIAENPNCSPRLIKRFLSIQPVWPCLARNPRASPETLEAISVLPETWVWVARNPNASRTTLERLSKVPDEIVQHYANNNLRGELGDFAFR